MQQQPMTEMERWSRDKSDRVAFYLKAPDQSSQFLTLNQIFCDPRLGWSVDGSFSENEDVAVAKIVTGEASLLILEDSKVRPAMEVLQKLLRIDVMALTPILVIALGEEREQSTSYRCLKAFSNVTVIHRGFSRDSLYRALNEMAKEWNGGPLKGIRLLAKDLKQRKNEMFAVRLQQLLQIYPDHSLLTLAEAHRLRRSEEGASIFQQQKNIRRIERVLLRGIFPEIEEQPIRLDEILRSIDSEGRRYKTRMELTCALPLIDFYIEHGLLREALLLAKFAFTAYGHPHVLAMPIIQCLLLLNQAEEAIPYLRYLDSCKERQVSAAHPYGDMRDILNRVYYACGMIHELVANNPNKPDILTHFRRAWHESPKGVDHTHRTLHQDIVQQLRQKRTSA